MKIKHYIALAALTMPLAASAQSHEIDFETNAGYTSVDVFDTWENSPFRKGELTGNVKVVSNPNKENDELAGEVNPSAKALAFQRSRFGSNTFGVRVNLKTPIALSQSAQYVHVMMLKPKAGRVMCFALGSREDRPWQSKEVVQVEASSITKVGSDNKWYDAVFALTGAEGVNVHSLVFAPEVESQHDATEDYVAYIDNIVVNNSSMARIAYEAYPTNFLKTEKLSRSDRYAKGISMKSSDGAQSIAVNQQSDKLIFQDYLSSQMKAKAGETVTVNTDYNGTWMNAYVYLDQNKDGKFDCTLNENGTPTEGSDVMSYSNYKNKNSKGNQNGSADTRTLPDFTIPKDLKPGFYRLRYKIDWDYIDAAGNPGNADGGNTIKGNGGAVIDTRLNIHTDKVTLTRGLSNAGTNGEVTLADSVTAVNGQEIPFGQPVTVKFRPAAGFKLGAFTIRHGYNLKGDSLIHETPQYMDVVIPAYMAKNNTYTIPAELVDGDVCITPTFLTTESGGEATEKYALNFEKDLEINRPNNDRAFNSLSFNTTTNSTAQKLSSANKKLVYQDFSSKNIYVKDGDVITTNISYLGNGNQYMHAYLYVDLDGDGVFNTNVNADGTPAFDGEMLSYTYANGKNSKGANVGVNDKAACCWGATNSTPQFSLPAGLPKGTYRARVKIDWDNTDPAGTYGSKYNGNYINNNGGYVIDFNFDVVDEYPKVKLDVQTTDGSIVGAGNTGLPEYIMEGQDINVKAVGLDENYTTTGITVRHGKNLNGEQTVNGEKQWEEYTAEVTDGSCTIPGDKVNGDVRLTAVFKNNGSSPYNLVFADEFNTEDGSQPNSHFWTRSSRENPTWKRFCAQTVAGQEKTGWIEDGKLVLKCVKNTFDDELDGNKNKQTMISGAIESSDKVTFTYGKVEGRVKNIGHSGNFPAFWMMPNKATYGGWPYSGEIDIWEQIDTANTTYHTIHTKWANSTKDGSECMNKGNDPQKSGTSTAALDEYHTYGLEWTEDILKWFVDGKQVFSYARKTDLTGDNATAQWPYNKPFYLILNQSVGNGGWAANPDVNFEYETKFDWVRVYQKEGGDIATGINHAQANSDVDIYAYPGKVRIVSAKAAHVSIVDMQGRTVFAQTVQGNENVYLPSGVYVANGKKVLVP